MLDGAEQLVADRRLRSKAHELAVKRAARRKIADGNADLEADERVGRRARNDDELDPFAVRILDERRGARACVRSGPPELGGRKTMRRESLRDGSLVGIEKSQETYADGVGDARGIGGRRRDGKQLDLRRPQRITNHLPAAGGGLRQHGQAENIAVELAHRRRALG